MLRGARDDRTHHRCPPLLDGDLHFVAPAAEQRVWLDLAVAPVGRYLCGVRERPRHSWVWATIGCPHHGAEGYAGRRKLRDFAAIPVQLTAERCFRRITRSTRAARGSHAHIKSRAAPRDSSICEKIGRS